MSEKKKRLAIWIAIGVLFLLALFLVVKLAATGTGGSVSSASSAAQSAYSMVGDC